MLTPSIHTVPAAVPSSNPKRASLAVSLASKVTVKVCQVVPTSTTRDRP